MNRITAAMAVAGTALALALSSGSVLAADTDQQTTDPAKKYHFQKRADGSEWAETPWGRLGVARLATAPFPDDTRTTGFVSKRGTFPFAGHYDDNRVAIAVPRQLVGRPVRRVDLIVHFHGHLNECLRAVEQFQLGDQLAASGCHAVLVVPQGPKDVPDSSGGKLEKPGAFAAFVDELQGVLEKSGALASPKVEIRNIVLSGHSGAYRVMARILDVGGKWDQIREVWLFDAAYGNLDELALPGTAPASERKHLRSIFTDHLATENSQIMSRLYLAGARPAIVYDDLLTTGGTTAREAPAAEGALRKVRTPHASLEEILKAEPWLFIYTSLAHNDVIAARRYFERFARSSPFLEKAR